MCLMRGLTAVGWQHQGVDLGLQAIGGGLVESRKRTARH